MSSSSTSQHSYAGIDPADMLVMPEGALSTRTNPPPPPNHPPTPARPRTKVKTRRSITCLPRIFHRSMSLDQSNRMVLSTRPSSTRSSSRGPSARSSLGTLTRSSSRELTELSSREPTRSSSKTLLARLFDENYRLHNEMNYFREVFHHYRDEVQKLHDRNYYLELSLTRLKTQLTTSEGVTVQLQEALNKKPPPVAPRRRRGR